MSKNLLTLTRQSLYELVWSKPMSELAGNFGISNVGLAKRCKQVDVPVLPYRGYWTRIAAGQKPDKIPLLKYRTRTAATAPATTTPPKPPRAILRDGPEPTDYRRLNEEAFRSLLLRVTGFDGRIARKLRNAETHGDDLSDEEDDAGDVDGY